jgi:hypothetical protein
MSDYTPKLKKILREAGCYFDRPGKGHSVLVVMKKIPKVGEMVP